MNQLFQDTDLGFLFLDKNELDNYLEIVNSRDYGNFKQDCREMLEIINKYENEGLKEKPFLFSNLQVRLGENALDSIKNGMLKAIINDNSINAELEYGFLKRILFYKCSVVYNDYFFVDDEFYFTVEMLKMLDEYYEKIYRIEDETHIDIELYGDLKLGMAFPLMIDKELLKEVQSKLIEVKDTSTNLFVSKELLFFSEMVDKSLNENAKFIILSHN